jgi:four helix bundle protein
MENKVNSYKDLIVWQKSVELVKLVYSCVQTMPKSEEFGLTSQIKRSCVSIPANIAEGWGRASSKSYINFLRIAKGSLFELETLLHLTEELNLVKTDNRIQDLLNELSKMLNALIKSITNKMNLEISTLS